MTTLEELVETFIDGDGLQDARSGLLAVLEKHVGPMLAEAFKGGVTAACHEENSPLWPWQSNAYAARILAQLTKQNERTG